MKNYIKELERLRNESQTGNSLTFENITAQIILNPADQGLDVKGLIELKLPGDYLEFLQHYDGMILYKVEDIAGFHFFGLKELYKQNKFQKENFGTDWDDRVILFCEIFGDNEYLGFRFDGHKYGIVYCIMEQLPQEWEQIEGTFEELLVNIIKEKGRKYWL